MIKSVINMNYKLKVLYLLLFHSHSRQETIMLSPEGLLMSNSIELISSAVSSQIF